MAVAAEYPRHGRGAAATRLRGTTQQARRYFPPWANTKGCVQDVVYYDLEEDRVTGVVTGEVAGSCYEYASFSFARAPGTNAYLLVIDDISVAVPPEPVASDGFEFACSVENGLYTPGAYELINGSCGLLHEVPEFPVTCPAQTDYVPDETCKKSAGARTRPALLVLSLVAACLVALAWP